MSLHEMYSDIILELHKSPMNKEDMQDFSAKITAGNPLCGDKIELFLKIEKGKITKATFLGTGCAISTAGNSLLTENIKNKTLEELKNLKQEEVLGWFGNIIESRQKCALLAWFALQKGLQDYKGETLEIKLVV